LIIFSLVNGGPEKGRLVSQKGIGRSGTFTTDTASELDVFWHDGDSLGVDGAQVGVFEKTHQVSLTKRWNGNLRIRSSVDFW
jgi:hypothetical protein